MDEQISASIGAADLPYNAVAAALEGAAKSAGLSREPAPDARPIELHLVEYEGKGSWLQLAAEGPAVRQLSKMLGAPLAKSLRRALTLFIVSAQGASLAAEGYRIQSTGKLHPTASPAPAPNGAEPGAAEQALATLMGVSAEAKVVHRQKRVYFHRPTTGNARLDRFIDAFRQAEKVELQREPDGRVAIRLLLPNGIRQMSFFTEDELERVRAAVDLGSKLVG